MKNIIKQQCLILGLLLIGLSSCQKEAIQVDNKSSVISALKAVVDRHVQTDADIYIINDDIQTTYESHSNSFSFQGILNEDFNCSNVSINDYSIDLNEENSFYASNTIDESLANRTSDFFGNVNQIEFCNETILSNFYIPRNPRLLNLNNTSFVKEEGINLEFSFDENNENPNVAVLQYVPDDIAEGESIITKSFIIEAGANSLNIAASELFGFPVGQNLILYLGSGSFATKQYNEKTYGIQSLAITSLPNIVLE